MRVWLLVSVVGIVGAFGVGCAATPDKQGKTDPQPAMRALGQPLPAPTPKLEEGSNESIGLGIRRILDGDAASSAGIVVEVDNGKVTLRGSAPNFATSARAEAAAHSVKGVKSVVNQINVMTPTGAP